MTRAHVVVENAAVVHDASQNIHAIFLSGAEHMLAGPGFKGIQDDHRPVHAVAETLEALDHVECEAVRGSGGDAEAVGEAGGFRTFKRLPERLAGVAELVGVVEHE
mgnify:CR=1 FL=1